MAGISVVIASGRGGRRAVCRRLLARERGIRVAGEARSGLEAIAMAGQHRPRVLVLDVGLSGRDGALLQAVRARSPRTRVILLARMASQAQLLDALSRGARGSLDTRLLRRFLAKAVRAVAADEAWVPRKLVARILDRLARLKARLEPARSGR